MVFKLPLRPPFSEDEKKTVRIIEAYTGGAASLADTVSALATPIDEAYTAGDFSYSSSDTSGRLWSLWRTILRHVRSIPWDAATKQNKLVEVLGALKQRPDPQEPLKPPGPVQPLNILQEWCSPTLWRSLIIFGASAREEWNEAPGIRRGGSLKDETREWTNLNAFVARVTAAKIDDFTTYAKWAMTDAFGGGTPVSDDTTDDNTEDDVEVRNLDTYVPAAAVWILYMGKQLYSKIGEQGEPEEQDKVERGNRITQERWNTWKRNFEAMAVRADLASETRRMAEQAANAMIAIEQA